MQFLANFDNLTSLNLDHNRIDENTVFPYMPTLELLWLNNNNVQSLYPFVKNLHRSVPNLKYLSIMGNNAAPSYLNGGSFYGYLQYRCVLMEDVPSTALRSNESPPMKSIYIYLKCARHLSNRLYVLSWFPNLVHLDDRTVTDDQRKEAIRLFNRPSYKTAVLPELRYISDLRKKLFPAKPAGDSARPPIESRNLIV